MRDQGKLLDDLGNAVVKASDVIKSHCPTRVSFTPTERLADMQQRLEGMVEAVNIVQPPLAKFYDALSDEQKARFNDVGASSGSPSRRAQQQAAQNPQSQCGENAMAFPTDRIDQVVHPTDAQRAKLDALQSASAKGVDLIKSRMPDRTSGYAARPSRDGGQAAAGHAAGRADDPPGARRFLRFAERRSEGALQHDRPAVVCREVIRRCSVGAGYAASLSSGWPLRAGPLAANPP